MTRKVKKDNVEIILIEVEENSICAYCGEVDELRPYGKNQQRICFDCAMKPENKAETNRQFTKFLTNEETH